MSIITDPTVWGDILFGTPQPPPSIWWEAVEPDDRWWWHEVSPGGFPSTVLYVGDEPLTAGDVLHFAWEVVESSGGLPHMFVYRFSDSDEYTTAVLATGETGVIDVTIPEDPTYFEWGVANGGFDTSFYSGVVAVGEAPECLSDEFNCECEPVSPYATLATLRTEMMIGMGYAAQASNPPPGMNTLSDFLLRQAQEALWLQYEQVRCERFFRWTMVPGLRYYGIADDDACCAGVLDPLKISWVGFEDLNKTWVQLIEGIPPEFYTRAQTTTGWPSHYEIRQCIELFPAPQAAYSLWIKGNFGLGPLTAPTDRTTIDDRAVLWYALGLSGRGPFAGNVGINMAIRRIMNITAGQHNTARFVPSPGGPLSPMTPPRYLPLGNEPA